MPRVRAFLARATLASALLGAWPANAQKSPPEPSPAPPSPPELIASDAATSADAGAKARARALYEQGAQAYEAGRYAEAADAFLDANRLYPTPQLCFNVARAYEKLGQRSGALRYYREYLRVSSDAPDAAETTARVRELEQALAARGVQQLTVFSKPEGATVSLDGQPVGVTPWTGETWPGRHRLALSLAGHAPSEDLIEIDVHRASDADVSLTPLAPAAPRPLPPPPASGGAPRVSALTWIALAAGTAGLGSALVVEMAEGENRGISRTGAFLAGTGLAASALGGVLLYLDLDEPARGSASARRLELGLAVGATRAAISGRF